MKSTYRFVYAQIAILCLTILGNALTTQSQNITPPGLAGNQSKINTPALLSINNFVATSLSNTNAPLNTNTVTVNQTIWDGNTWSNGFPDASKKAVITANFESADIIEANSIEIDEGGTLTLHAGGMLKLNQPLTESTKSKLNLEDGAGLLIKTIDARNPNSVLSTFERVHSKYVNQYTGLYMSSPVSGQEIGSTNASIAYSQSKYNNSGYVYIEPTEIMQPAIGYTETGDGNGNYTQGGVPSQGGSFHRQKYIGTENTSDYVVSLNGAGGYNLVGNPYSSYLDVDSFLQDLSNASAGTIYLWTHNTLASLSGNGLETFKFSSNDFAVYNLLGGVNAGKDISPAGPSGTNNYDIPDGKIAFGTGFFVLGSGTATFKTSMTTSIGSQIFRTRGHNRVSSPSALIPPPARHRIWLNLNNQAGTSYRQTMIGYATGAKNTGPDLKFDSPTIDQTSNQPIIDLYSFAPSSSTKLAIQGYNLATMQNTDSFQLGYKGTVGSTYTFTSTSDGMFPGKPYYILDARDGIYHTLPYTFTATSGDFDTRFKVVFENLVGLSSPVGICGSTLANIENVVFSTQIANATNYKFQVRTGGASPGTSLVGVFDGNAGAPYKFRLNVPGVSPNTTYYVSVATYQIDGNWAYGYDCQITTPPPPTSFITFPVCGSTITNTWGRISALQIVNQFLTDATLYRFNATIGSGTTIYTTAASASVNTSLQLFPSMPLTTNTTYNISVDVFWGGAWRNGTSICQINTGNVITRRSETDISIFETLASPNPFEDNFQLHINTSSEEAIQILVYDMLGRQIEERTIQVADLDTQEIGNNYASGVYNLIIKQADNTKTLRVIKR